MSEHREEEIVGPPSWLILGSLTLLILLPAGFALYTIMTSPDSAFQDAMSRNSDLGGGPFWLIGTFLVIIPVVGLWVAYVWKRSREAEK